MVEEAIDVGAKVVWFQLGLRHGGGGAGPGCGSRRRPGPVPQDRTRPVRRWTPPRWFRHRRDHLEAPPADRGESSSERSDPVVAGCAPVRPDPSPRAPGSRSSPPGRADPSSARTSRRSGCPPTGPTPRPTLPAPASARRRCPAASSRRARPAWRACRRRSAGHSGGPCSHGAHQHRRVCRLVSIHLEGRGETRRL